MALDATSVGLPEGRAAVYVPEQSLSVACLLNLSGGFLDAFTRLSLGGVFANSQTGNVVSPGIYAGGLVTMRLGTGGLAVPISLLVFVLWLCCRYRRR